MSEFRICIVAAGARGRAHARAWSQIPDAQLIAVADVEEERAHALANEYGMRAYADFREMLEREDCNVVSVCTPASLHCAPTVLAAQKGCHVLCEKPIALTIEDGEAMIEATRKANVKLGFFFQRRFGYASQKLDKLLAENAVGRPVLWRIFSEAEIRPKLAMHDKHGNNGPIGDYCPHLFDRWRWLLKTEALRVAARGFVYARGKPEVASIRELAIDTAAIIIEFASGDIGAIVITWGLPRGLGWRNSEAILGPNGIIDVDGEAKLTISRPEGQETFTVEDKLDMDLALVQDFIDAIRTNRTPKATGEDALAALKMSLATLQAIETGNWVSLA